MYTLKRTFSKEKGKQIWINEKGAVASSQPNSTNPPLGSNFKFSTLKGEDGKTYTEQETINFLKLSGKLDDKERLIEMWIKYGSNKERALLVFEHRKEV